MQSTSETICKFNSFCTRRPNCPFKHLDNFEESKVRENTYIACKFKLNCKNPYC